MKAGGGAFWMVWRWKLHWQILLGLLLGALGGWGLASLAGSGAADARGNLAALKSTAIWQIANAGGEMFLAGLKMIVVPLVLSSIITSVASIANRQGFARLGLKTLAFYLLTGLLAIVLGLILVNLLRPGVSASGQPLLGESNLGSVREAFEADARKLQEGRALLDSRGGETMLARLLGVLRSLVPANPVKAMVEMDLLGLICWAMLFGFFMGRLPADLRDLATRFWEGVNQISLGMTELVLRFAPVGVALLLVRSLSENIVALAGENRIGEFGSALQWLAVTVVLALGLHLFGVMSLVVGLMGRVNPLANLKAFAPALLTAFSTSSSNATISVTLDCAEKRAGVSNGIASFVIPLGATVNMNGTALYECVAAIFVAQMFGIELDWSIQFLIVLTALLTSVGVAGVPSASLVAILIILESVSRQLPGGRVNLVEGLPILLILDRPLDMCRTAVNVFGDACAAVVIARTEGETLFQKEAET